MPNVYFAISADEEEIYDTHRNLSFGQMKEREQRRFMVRFKAIAR